MLKIFIFFIIIGVVKTPSFAQENILHYYKLLYGRWYHNELNESYTEYGADSTYNTYIYGESAKALMGFQTEDVDTISPWKNGEQRYYLTFEGDELVFCFYTTTDPQLRILKSYILSLTKDQSVSITYKNGKGIEDHIDGVSVRYREEKKKLFYDFSEDDLKTKFILPEGFTGYVVVLYDQEEKYTGEMDKKGRRILKINENGLLQTSFSVDPLTFATREFGFYYKDDTILRRIPIIMSSIRSPYTSKTTIVKAYLEHLDKETIYVMPYGYNQFARDLINKKFNKYLKGNAEIYYIGKLKDMIGKTPVFIKDE